MTSKCRPTITLPRSCINSRLQRNSRLNQIQPKKPDMRKKATQNQETHNLKQSNFRLYSQKQTIVWSKNISEKRNLVQIKATPANSIKSMSTPSISMNCSTNNNALPSISHSSSDYSPVPSKVNESQTPVLQKKQAEPKWSDTTKEVKSQADAGNIEAMYIYANILFTGRGVVMDRTTARKYFQKAANNGHCKAQVQYADILLNGWGIPKNPKVACKYLAKAVESGDLEAMSTLGKCYRDAIGVEKDIEKAEQILRRGADADHAACQFELGQLLEIKGIEFKDEALSYYQKASKQNFPAASANFLRLLNRRC